MKKYLFPTASLAVLALAAPTVAAATTPELVLTVPTSGCDSGSWLQVTTPDGKGDFVLDDNTLAITSALIGDGVDHRFTVQTNQPVDGCYVTGVGVLTLDGTVVDAYQRDLAAGGANLQVTWRSEEQAPEPEPEPDPEPEEPGNDDEDESVPLIPLEPAQPVDEEPGEDEDSIPLTPLVPATPIGPKPETETPKVPEVEDVDEVEVPELVTPAVSAPERETTGEVVTPETTPSVVHRVEVGTAISTEAATPVTVEPRTAG